MNVDPGEYVRLPGDNHVTYRFHNHVFTKFVLVDYGDNANTVQPTLFAVDGISNFSPALSSGFLAFREYRTEFFYYLNNQPSLLHLMSNRSVGDLAFRCFKKNIKVDLNHIFLVGDSYPRVKAIPIAAEQDDLESLKTSLIQFYSNVNNICQARVGGGAHPVVNDPEFTNFTGRLNACISISGIEKSLNSFFFWNSDKRYCIICQFNEFVEMHSNVFDREFRVDQIYTWRSSMMLDSYLKPLIKFPHPRPDMADEVDDFLLFIRNHVAHFTLMCKTSVFNDAESLILYLDQRYWRIMHQVYEAVERIEDDVHFDFKFDFQSIDDSDPAN